MKKFTVCNSLELGVAVTESEPGDVISISSGDYTAIPLKVDVALEFPEDYSVRVAFVPFGVGLADKCRCGRISAEGVSIKNLNMDPEIIRGVYVYRKKLPFEVSFEGGFSYLHPNGTVINILGNDKDRFSIGPSGDGADKGLPKGVVEVQIPFIDDIKIPLKSSYGLRDEVWEFENRNPAPGCNLNDFEYLALWSINSFIMLYGRLTGKEKKVAGYSTAEFKDGHDYGRANNPSDLVFSTISYVDNYSPSQQVDHLLIQSNLLNTNVFSLSNYIEEQLNRLNYSQAVIAMSDFIDNYYGGGAKKYSGIDASMLEESEKILLSEVVLVRNALLHFRKFALIDKVRDYLRVKGKYPQLREISEFEIFAMKRPWFWYEAFKKWKNLNGPS